MKDEGRCVVRLTHSSTERDVTLYHFQIEQSSNLYRFAARYSKLRAIAELLPKTQRKFPEPCHLSMAFSVLLGNKSLLEDRYSKMTKYFDQISKLPQLVKNEGLKRMLEQSELVKCASGVDQDVVPCAPRLKGKKLCSKNIGDQLLIVIG